MGVTESKGRASCGLRLLGMERRSGTHRSCRAQWVPLDVDWSAKRNPRQRQFQRCTPFRSRVQPYTPLRCPLLGNSAKRSRLKHSMPGTTARTQPRFTRPAGSRGDAFHRDRGPIQGTSRYLAAGGTASARLFTHRGPGHFGTILNPARVTLTSLRTAALEGRELAAAKA